jgi:uncharacterized YigZ family protein
VSRYAIPAGRHRVEQEIRGSRFIATVAHTPTVEAARAFIAEVSAEFADATHNCWAYVVGPPGSTAQIGMSDDGEPHGTAGRPMLNVLLHAGIGDVSAVVTRYFGGTKLGTGGLVRAYSGTVHHALETLPTREHVPRAGLVVTVDYAAVGGVQRLLAEHEAEIEGETYGADVAYRLWLPRERLETFTAQLRDLTHGRAAIEPVDREVPDAGAA